MAGSVSHGRPEPLGVLCRALPSWALEGVCSWAFVKLWYRLLKVFVELPMNRMGRPLCYVRDV